MAMHPEALRGEFTYVLARAATFARTACSGALGTVGLLPAEHGIMACLREAGPLIQRDIADMLALDQGDLVAYLDRLETRGAIDRSPDPQDRRRRLIALTPAGTTLLQSADGVLDEASRHFTSPLTSGEVQATKTALKRLLEFHDEPHWVGQHDQPTKKA